MRHQSYWERGIALEKPAIGLPARADVLIVGAGFMGLWLAYYLCKLKPSLAGGILVVERDLLGYGASTRNAGFLTSGNISEMLADSRDVGREAIFEQFSKRRAGLVIVLEEFRELQTDPCGSADYDPVTPEKIALRDALNYMLVERREDAAFVTKRVWFGGSEREVFFNAGDRGVNPVDLLSLLRKKCAERGVKFAFGVQVDSARDGLASCSLPGSQGGDSPSPPAATGTVPLRYGHAFLCVNAFASELHAQSAIVPGRGQVIVTSPVKAQTSHHLGFINDGYDYFKFVDGRLLIGGGRDKFRATEETRDLTPTSEVRDYLVGRAKEIIGHANFTVDYHWAGIMGFPGGRHVAGAHRVALDASTFNLNACGGMGVALTPLVGRATAQEFL